MTTPLTVADIERSSSSSASTLDFAIVGIGASAGGLAALSRLLAHVAPQPRMTFVVVLHLSPTHQSHATEILQRSTSLKVIQVTDAMTIECDRVYVVPPGKDLRMADNRLHLSEQARASGRQRGIDLFFRTLAEAHSTRAFGIILSGTGNDGVIGLTSLKEHSGVSMAQRPDEAEHDGMPLAAIAAGVVDFILPVAEMPERLAALWDNARRIRLPDLQPTSIELSSSSDRAGAADASETALNDVLGLLRTRTRHEFRRYKRGTVLRRIERRMQVNAIPDLPSYRDFLREHDTETAPLLQDMLISVTNFFRDPEAFEALASEAIGRMIEQRGPNDPLRVWVPGCATGEEAYSIAILLREQCDARNRHNEIQIFATDIDERAIAVARAGAYSTAIATDLTPLRLRRFFRRDGEQYQISKLVRETVLFAAHNVLRDPPFSRLDLICCRNLLIYLNHDAQATVLETFRSALRPDGFLFLGSSESSDALDDAFVPIDKKHRLYRANPTETQPHPARTYAPLAQIKPLAVDGNPNESRARSLAELHQQALERHALPSVLIDSRHHILHLSPGVGRFLEHASGKPSHDLIGNAAPPLRIELRAALFRRTQTDDDVVVRGIEVRGAEGARLVDLYVYPVRDAQRTPGEMTLVMFGERAMEASETVAGTSGADAVLTSRLESELDSLKAHLQETVDRFDSSTEDLKASNEELQAMNEELRSATEELETSKEELQSINEELTTVNDELKSKVEEKAKINDDLQNLIASTDIAVVFVDAAMNIKRYTPRATELFTLIPSDIGRPLSDVKHRFEGIDPVADAQETFRNLKPHEREVRGYDGRYYLARVLPYRTIEDRIEGAILTYVDITSRREAEAEAYRITQRLRQAAESTRDFAIISMDDRGAIRAWNLGAQRIFGYAEDEAIGQSIELIYSDEDREAGVPAIEMEGARKNGRAEDESWHVRKDGSRFFCSGVLSLMHDAAGFGFSKIARDMTGSKILEARREAELMRETATRVEAEAANRLKDEFLAVMSHELKHPLNLIHINAELLTRSPEASGSVLVRRAAETIRQTVANQAKIIDDLLDLSRARTGKMTLTVAPVRFDEIVRNIHEATAAEANARRIALAFDHDRASAVNVMGDRVRLEQIVWNLVSNALKFTQDGGAITLTLRSEGRMARFEVKDSGRGIAPQFLAQVFGMFQQEHRAYAQGEGGMGIGLALVKELTEAHEGQVAVHSEGVGRGTTFTIRLPLAADVALPGSVEDDASNPLRGLRVLLVDDARDILEIVAELIELEGAYVTACDNGKAALASLDEKEYDLLISDVGMPDMDGYQLIDEVRRRPQAKHLTAIALTGFGRAADARRASAVGFDAHLPKPTSIDELKALLTSLGFDRQR